jgi:hypothetical protein
MSTAQAKPSKTTATQVKVPPAANKTAASKIVKKAPAATKPAPSNTKVSELSVAYQIAPLDKKKKNDKKKVIRDSFSFPEHDHHKITELKKICLTAGVHVKKGEILRAGLGLLVDLKLSELLKAVEKVERVRTGRPKSDKH